MATVHLHDPTDPLRGAAARIEWSGRIRYNDDFSGDAMQSRGPAVVNPNQWQAFSLEIRPILTRASINGQARRTTYHSQPDSGDLKAKVSCSGSTAEFRNITLYVGSKVETDNAAVEALLKAFSQSIDSLDLKAAEESSKKLIQILDQVPEANLHVAEIATATARLRTMRSAEGLSLCTKEVLDTATYSHGRWNIENNWLIIRQCRNCQRASRLRLPLRATDFELSAVVEFRNPGKDTYVDLHWNAPEDPGLAGRAPRVWIWPVQGAVGVTTKSPDGDESRGSRAKAELTGPMAFCLRVRGQAARLFIHDGEKPVASVSDFKAAGRSMFIQGHFLGEDGEIHFKDLILRHLPKGRKLDAPAELPEVAGKQPRTQPAK